MSTSPECPVRIMGLSGEPDALRIVEKSNWTGQGLVFPTAQVADVRLPLELKHTGVYVLWDPSELGQLPHVCVGEGDPVLLQFDRHPSGATLGLLEQIRRAAWSRTCW